MQAWWVSPLEFKGSIQLSFDCLHTEWMLVGDTGDMLDAGLCKYPIREEWAELVLHGLNGLPS